MKRTELKHFDLPDLEKHKLVWITPGHAPSVVTTINPEGKVNVATFEQTMLVSYLPPRIVLAITPVCDTYKNLQDGSDCVVGFPRPADIQVAYDCGVKLPREVSELDVVEGLSTRPSQVVKSPQLEQCWINIECRLRETLPAGDHHVLLLDALHVTLDTSVWKEDRVARRTNLPAVYYTTSGNFFVPGNQTQVSLSQELSQYQNGD